MMLCIVFHLNSVELIKVNVQKNSQNKILDNLPKGLLPFLDNKTKTISIYSSYLTV